MLSHEKLVVYQKSIEFLAVSVEVTRLLPRGYSSIVDQIKRASISVPLNIAEACGRTGSADNARHFSIARGSALESGAILDVCFKMELITDSLWKKGKDLLVHIVAMLTKLAMKGS